MGAVKNKNRAVDIIVTIIKYFILRGKMRFSVQFFRKGPNLGWPYIQACIFGELLAKQYAAMTIKMLNGKPGVIIPRYASPRLIKPRIRKNSLFIILLW